MTTGIGSYSAGGNIADTYYAVQIALGLEYRRVRISES